LANDKEKPDTWLARRDQVKARLSNGNGMGMPLTIAAKMLPTPRAFSAITGPTNSQANLGGRRFRNLETVIGREQLTPQPGNQGPPLLLEMLEMRRLPKLPTPTTRDWKDGQWHEGQESTPSNGMLGREVHRYSTPTGEPTYLNPSFVEEMMGYEIGWTDLRR
jgi:hypothetical protein